MPNLLIENLLKSPEFNNPKLIETHISWVILTGEYAYKIKKPVDFEFLNYSSLEKRKYYCEEEVRLNKALAPELYLQVVTINGDLQQPQINGEGCVLEYAIKMREFSQQSLFSNLLAKQQLTPLLIEKLAQQVATFHQKTPTADPNSILGNPEHVHAPVIQNFDQIFPLLTDESDRKQLQHLQQWSQVQYQQHYNLLKKRKQQGFIRACHGDLHLGNIILHQEKPVLFDCIEFNEDFRWTDTMADIAFLAMDLDDHQQAIFAQRLLNIYCQETGDYEGLILLPYYEVYRALVRAKVALFGLAHGQHNDAEKNLILTQYRRLIELATRYTQNHEPTLYIMHGYTGSGKSITAARLVEEKSAFCVRSDVERKRLAGLPALAKTNSEINAGLYTAAMTEKTYQRLADCASLIISAGYNAIVDAAFLKKSQRCLFHTLAIKLNIGFVIVDCQVPREKMLQWIAERNATNQDASEADVKILEMQEKTAEALTIEEEKQLMR